MKLLQEEVRIITQLSVDALEGAALELDAIHLRQTRRLRRNAAAEQVVHAESWAQAQAANELSFRLLAEELAGIECMCCEAEGLPLAEAVSIEEEEEEADEGEEDPAPDSRLSASQWYTPVSATPYFTPASTLARPATHDGGEEVEREAVRAVEGFFSEGGMGASTQRPATGPEALEAWLVSRKAALQAARGGDGPSGGAGESQAGNALGDEVTELRREVASLKALLEDERRAKQKILNSSVVCPECEAIF